MAIDEANTAIVYLLANDATVSALVGDRISPWVQLQSQDLPAITYHQVSSDRVSSMDGSSGLAALRFQIDCWASTYAGVKALAEAVRLELEGYKGSPVSAVIHAVFLENDSDVAVSVEPGRQEPAIYRVSMDFVVWADESRA